MASGGWEGGDTMKRILILVAALAVFASRRGALTDSELLDTIQHASFLYFWNEANPSNGLIRDRSQPGSPCSIAANGFGFSAITIGIDHGWITRAEGRARDAHDAPDVLERPQGRPTRHDGYQGPVLPLPRHEHRTARVEQRAVDDRHGAAVRRDPRREAVLHENDPDEMQIRALADSIYFRADWEFMRNLGPGIRMGWKPVGGFSGSARGSATTRR
jgi:hypothetical protein